MTTDVPTNTGAPPGLSWSGIRRRLGERRDVLSLMGLTLAAKPLGFAVQLLIASSFGAGPQTDAYFVSIFLASFLASIGVHVFTTLVIPLYYDHVGGETPRSTNAFLNGVLLLFTAPLVAFALLLYLAPRLAIAVAAPGFAGETLGWAESMTRIMSLGLIATGIGGYLSALLNMRRVYWLPGLAPLVQSAALLGGILLLRGRLGAMALPVSFLAAALLRMLIQAPAALGLGLVTWAAPARRDPALQRLQSLARPVLVSALIIQALFMVDKVMGSLLAEGSVSALGYANALNMFALNIFAGTLMTVMFTNLSALKAEKKIAEFGAAFRSDARYLLALIVPVAVLALVKSDEIVAILFQRGEFDRAASANTGAVLAMYSLGLPMLGMNMLLGRVFHSMKAMSQRMWIDLVWIVTNVGANLLLIGPLGARGLALGTSIASAVNVALAMIYLRRRRAEVGDLAVGRALLESLLAGGAMAAAILLVPLERWLGPSDSFGAAAIALSAAALVGGAAYTLVLLLARRLASASSGR